MTREELILLKYSKVEIIKRRNDIRIELKKKSLNLNKSRIFGIASIDIKILFELYDKHFFKGFFISNDLKVDFSVSKRMTRAAAKTIYSINKRNLEEKYEIRVGVDFFQNYYDVKGNKRVCGIETEDAMEAFMLVFEHELIHLLEFYVFKKSSCSNKRFKGLAYNIFGHESSYHELPTNREIAKSKFDIRIGDRVTFIHNKKINSGIIYKINKNAVVMVNDKNGNYSDKQGNKYSKWYVPLEKLIKK